MWRNFDTPMFRLNGGAAQIRYLSSSNIFPPFEKNYIKKVRVSWDSNQGQSDENFRYNRVR